MERLDECYKPGSSDPISTQQSLPKTVVTIPSVVIVSTERTLRHLARELAMSMLPTLRQLCTVPIKLERIELWRNGRFPTTQEVIVSEWEHTVTLRVFLNLDGHCWELVADIIPATPISGNYKMLSGSNPIVWPLVIQ